jgi:cold shock protein|tara:strand:- start:1018 stop:1233 length:216 start_codon:yes stop_codon:yes gene_type:complete
MSKRKSGELKKFFSDKGYGFIQSQKGDIFFHISDSEDLDINSLKEEITLSYEESKDVRSGKTKAINVTIEE